ncbi:hypothetical protein CBP51_05030 [Cellvibrio mixtus]|uniref:JmjC domain-containing protein n=1 Tax=Cellvibrio mixtus TaxID=39650 RepID=A0A266Q916_9GAMM|nr:cupin-like domain-containing protein [Cellvibrio mixtus]OZY86393.1 hypothetical protein CBP51_05030 [Cellvibrio mixtus]
MKIEVLHGFVEGRHLFEEYVKTARPLVIKGYAKDWRAVRDWSASFFKEHFGEEEIVAKKFCGDGVIMRRKYKLSTYMDSLMAYEKSHASGQDAERPDYWHDVPIFETYKDLLAYVDGFDPGILPAFYQHDWHRHVQFFMSSPGSVTRLHFDTLRTHNLFFQITGKKKWTILPSAHEQFCERNRWRWFGVDPEAPDLARFPQYEKASATSILIEPGDLFYIPPGVLHQVRSLDTCISFNIDFHTPDSVLRSFSYLFKGMPQKSCITTPFVFLG